MTSRPSAGAHRQPQRSLSGTGNLQRQTPQRTLSQQYATASVKRPDNFVDLTLDGSETGRHGFQKIGGSRLKLQLSKDPKDSAIPFESPKAADVVSSLQTARGRPKLRFESHRPQLQVGDESLVSSIRGVENITSHEALPMPKRPVQCAPSFSRGKRPSTTNMLKKDIRPKPYTLEVPLAAPHYLVNGHADFFPWTGDHPEDQFNDHVIRHGFFDKSQTTQNEAGSAKISILPALKHKSGLQTLSSLFTSVLAQRRTHGQITSTPTFKPPPRVTLTDTKRETWLRDLANPTTSLRRLSRTIPHGIRGKVLLEQCLSKRIPTERAVWLAKCVGANEIRAFKRKGATGTFALGGEAKWIRDWTIFVEQFVESIVASCGEHDWKGRMLYAVRLAAHLYSEHLLDREHYMDWLSTSMETCPSTKIPVWLLIVQIYWKDLLKSRKYGRRLVAALCAHLHATYANPDRDLLLPLIERIALLIKGLLETNSENFISPGSWAKYKTTLVSCLFPIHQRELPIYTAVDERNQRLSPIIFCRDISPHQLIIKLLDRTLSYPFTADLPEKCRDIMDDPLVLAQSVIAWSTSSYRPGIAKIYVGARLLRSWSNSGIDVNGAVLGFLGSGISGASLCKASFYHLASELIRSGHFCVSKYLQWLIARGGVRSPGDLAKDAPCATRLLAELPTNDLPDSITKLRRTMLSRASFSLEDELEDIRAHTGLVKSSIPRPENGLAYDTDDEKLSRDSLITQRSDLSHTIKSEIAVCVRNQFNLHKIGSTIISTKGWKGENRSDVTLVISLLDFILARDILEDIEDLSMLVDVLQAGTFSDNPQVLTAVSDTLNFHIEAFAAIGAVSDLFDKLLNRLRSLKGNTDSTPLLASLLDLASRLPEAESEAVELSKDLARINQKTAADACSPVSDHMAEVLQNSESEFSDEIEKVLVSGTSMEQQTLQRLFEMIMSRIEASWTKPTLQSRDCATLLVRLRFFDTKHFDSLIRAWLQRLLHISARPSLVHVLGPLISADCLSLMEVILGSAAFLESQAATNDSSIAAKVAVETLALLLGGPEELMAMATSDAYRLGIKRTYLRNHNYKEALAVARRAVEWSSPSAGITHDYVCSFYNGDQMRDFLGHILLRDPSAVVQELVIPIAQGPHPESRKHIDSLVKRLLDPQASNSMGDQTLEYRIEHAIRLADDLTLPFCQLELQSILATEAPDWLNEPNETMGCLQAFERAIDLAIMSTNKSWTSIVPSLDIRIARHLCQRAERLVLQLIPPVKAEECDTPGVTADDDLAKRLLFVINATIYSLESSRASQLASQIVEKLNDLWHITSQGDVKARNDVILKWLPLILDFIALHININMFDSSKSSAEVRSRMLLSLSALLLEFQNHPNINATVLQRLFDVALLLVDELPEDARLNCARSLKDKISDPRIRYIFGYSASPTDWLLLNQMGKVVSYPLRRWEILSEPTPNIGENDTSLSLTLFKARRV